MGSTFLSLTNKVLARVNEVALTSSNFSGQQGLPNLAQNAVNDAIRQINQEEFQWPFNKAAGSQLMIAGTQLYALPADFKVVDPASFYIQRDESLEVSGTWLYPVGYDEWLRSYRSNDEETIANIADVVAIPSKVFLSNNEEFGLTDPPSKAFTVLYDYWTFPDDLVAHDDATGVPSRFDHVIVEGAMRRIHEMRDNYEAMGITNKDFLTGLKAMRGLLINKNERAYDNRTSHARTRG